MEDFFHQAVMVSISRGARSWTCTAVYASPVPSVRETLWNYLIQLRNSVQHPWLLLGDFNEVLLPSEVEGGSFFLSRAQKFAVVLE